MQIINIKMFPEKECGGSRRFAVPESEKKKVGATNVYVSRSVPGINEAKSITVTLVVDGQAAPKPEDEALLATLSK